MFKNFWVLLILSLIFLMSSTSFGFIVEAQERRPIVYTIEIDGDIKAGTSILIERAINLSEESNADYLVIKLNTPGGLIMSTKEIVAAMLETETNLVVFINRDAGWGYSAGTFILMAANYAVVHPTASIGAAQPIPADEKNIEAMASWIRGLAETNNRDGEIAERFVRENLTLTGSEAYEYGMIDATAENLDQLFYQLEITSPDIRTIEISFIERIFNSLSNPFLMGLFLMLGTLGLVMAFQTGELCITGFTSVIFLALGAWGMEVIDLNLLGIVLIVLGLIMLLIEVFAEPGFGLLGITGTGIAVFGIFSIEKEPFFAAEMWDPTVMIVLGAAITISILFVIIGRKAVETLKAKPVTGRETLVGQKITALKDFDPFGIIEAQGLKWTAKEIDNKKVKKGDLLEIVRVEGNTVFVKLKSQNHNSKL